MKQQRSFPAFKVSKRCENRLKGGHPWVYDNEIEVSDEGVENGCIADVLSPKGSYLGSGLVSLNSKIRVRILSDNANETFGESFFRRRIRYALDHRKTVMGDDISACRLVHGESDGLPGLTVDRYNDILSVQVLSYGMEQRKDMLYRLLTEELAADGVTLRGIMERNDVAIRELEGLEQGKGWYRADFLPTPPETPVTEICENGIYYKVDVENGQKTGSSQ